MASGILGATRTTKSSNPFVPRDAGDWTNMQACSHHVERSKVVNEGNRLDYLPLSKQLRLATILNLVGGNF